MKKSILTLVTIGATFSVFGQGFLSYANRVVGTVVAPVYGADASNVRASGNTQAGTPAGSAVYAGALLSGTNFSAQLYGANLVDQPATSLLPVSGIALFRTGSLAGTIPSVVIQIASIPIHGNGTFQLRAWDNTTGASWETATTRGQSDVFNVSNLGDGVLDLPATLSGLRSFNLTIVPEPSTFVLAGLGAAALVIFRRRK